MFKCCVCNSASKKANAERSKADDSPVESPRLTTVSAKVDDEIKSVKEDKLNGNVQSEQTSLLEDVSVVDKDALLEDKNASLKNKDVSLENKNVSLKDTDASLEDKDVLLKDKNVLLEDKNVSLKDKEASLEDKDVSLEDKDASLEDKDASLENKDASLKAKDILLEDKDASLENKDISLEDKDASLEDKNISLKDEDASLEDKDASLENKDVSLEDKNISLKDEDALDFTLVCTNFVMSPYETPQNGNGDVEESSSSTSTKETVEEAGEEIGNRIVNQIVDDKDNSVNQIVNDKDNSVNQIIDDSNFDGVAEYWMEEINSIVPVSPVKANLYDASGYIERTIDDGPEDEGDDSVFEGENEIKKTPAVASIPRWLSEEDDGEYVSGGCSGMQEPPATPIARDELALRRHRFFSDLLQAAQNSSEHRVRFDPLGPMVHTG